MNLDEVKKKNLKTREATRILIGMGSCGIAAGAKEVYDKFLEEVKNRNLDVSVEITGCVGYCHSEPTVNVYHKGKSSLLGHIHPEDVITILETFASGTELSKYLLIQNYECISLE